MPLTIRPALESEAPTLAALMHAAHAWNLANGFNFTAATITVDELRLRLDPQRFFAAEIGGRIVGTIEVKPEIEPGVWSLHLLTVDPAEGARGIGRALIAFAEDCARRAGARALTLDTPESHPWLPDFYRRLGYRMVGMAQWEGKHYRSVLMRKNLAD